MSEAYAGIGGVHWSEHAIRTLLAIFPEGQLCVVVNGRVVASVLAIIVDYAAYGDRRTDLYELRMKSDHKG